MKVSILIPPPEFLNFEVPSTEDAFNNIVDCFGAIDSSECDVLLTQTLQDFLIEYDHDVWTRYPIIREIHHYLNQQAINGMFWQVITSKCEEVTAYQPHPIPRSAQDGTYSDLWADEVGRILFLHLTKQRSPYFMGVICSNAFAGGQLGEYKETKLLDDYFPLVTPNSVSQLDDACEWILDYRFRNRDVRFSEAIRNMLALGATKIDRPPGGSHYKCHFPGHRPWPLDVNHDPLINDYLKELEPVTGLPLEVIKETLITGKLPSKIFKLA